MTTWTSTTTSTAPSTAPPEAATTGSPAVVYRAGLAAGQLLFQRCACCTRAVFFPRLVCPHCGSEGLTWARSAGRGTVYSSTVVRARSGPYNVSLIDLDEGFRMMCRVVGQHDETVAVGERVEAEIPPGTTPEELGFVVRAVSS